MSETPTYRNALPLNTMLLEYRLESVLGAGGFGLTYLAWDTNLEKHVAIKEYLPGDLTVRALDGSVVPVNTESEFNYKWGLDRFIQEARTLAKFTHPNIVHVNRYFEANGTSYMVMDYEAGESLHQYLRRVPMPDEATLKHILMPILDGLQAVHKSGFLHRDIKPSNVFMRANGISVLLDFGSARMVTGKISKSLTAIVSPGYAPLEQYSNDGNQGPWSDIYALSGVMFRAVTGENPPDAVKRIKSDSVPQALIAARTRYTERFLKAIEWGMTLDERIRPQCIADWRDLFLGRAPMTAISRGASVNTLRPAATAPEGAATGRAGELRSRATGPAASRRVTHGGSQPAGKRKWLIAVGVLLIVLVFAAIVWRQQRAIEVGMTQAPPNVQSGETAPQVAPPQESPSESESRLAAQPPPAIPQVEAVATSGPSTTAAAGTAQIPAATLPELPLDIRGRLTETFRSADSDGSGDLSRAEVNQKMRTIADKFDTIDTNLDGKLTLSEMETATRKDLANQPSPPRSLERAVQTVERAEATSAAGSGGETQIPFSIKKEFQAADRDGNGYLTREEIRGKFPFIEQNFSQVDTDRDGRISSGEFMQLRNQQQTPKSAR